MDFLSRYDKIRCAEFAAKIKTNTEEWQIVEVGLTGQLNVAHVAQKICTYFKGREGLTLLCDRRTILVLVHLGKSATLQATARGLQEHMPPKSCTVVAANITGDGIGRLQLHIHETCTHSANSTPPLLAERMQREERCVMLVEDDMFIRSLMTKAIRPHARIVELANTEGVINAYLEHLPDVVFLDIHLPDGSGLDVLKEVLHLDDTAHIIITTSDPTKENVLNAVNLGAKSFIAKNFTPEKLLDAYYKCPSVTP